MNTRSMAIQGGLALAGLAAAYATWQRTPELASGEVFAFDVTKNDLEKIRFDDEEIKVWSQLARAKDSNGPIVSVRLSGTDASNVVFPSGHPSVAVKVPERLVRGNEAAERVFETFAPLRASRALGTLDAAILKDLGLDTTKKFIEISARGNKRRLAVVPAPPGGSDPYVRDTQDGRVYIIARNILSDLQAASVNLVERRFHTFRVEEVDRIDIAAADRKRQFVVTRNDENLPGIRIAPKDAPDKFDLTLKNWHERIWNLFPAEVLGQDEVPPPGSAPLPAIRLTYFSRGRQLGWVEIARAGAPPPVAASSATAAPPSSDIFGRSEVGLGWAKLPADAATLLSEGETLMGRK